MTLDPNRPQTSVPDWPGNRILMAMTRAERRLIVMATGPVRLAPGSTPFSPGERIEHIVPAMMGLASQISPALPEAGRKRRIGNAGSTGPGTAIGEIPGSNDEARTSLYA